MAKEHNKKREAGIYLRGKTYWTKFNVSGKARRFSLRTGDANVAQRRATELRDTLIEREEFGDNKRTWQEAFVDWASWLSKEVSAKTMKRYAVSMKELEKDFGHLYIHEIDKKAITSFIARRRRTVLNGSIKNDLVALSSLLGFCEDQDWCKDNPALPRMKRIKARRDPIILPSPADVEKVIAEAYGNLALLIRAAWYTGCRQEELQTADRRRLDLKRGQLTVIGKGNRRRTMDLDDRAQGLLATVPAHIFSTLLFHHDGESYKNISGRYAECRKRAQKQAQAFQSHKFHDLRHLYAVEYLKNGGNIYTLQGLLGHRSVKTTEMYLAYLSPDEQLRAKHQVTKQDTSAKVLHLKNARSD